VTSKGLGGASAPSSLAMVCGSADCLYDDYDNAQLLYPGATIIAVNGAPLRAEHRFSVHWSNLKVKGWIEPGETVHSCVKDESSIPEASWVDQWWFGVNDVQGTSGWAAAKMALQMGHDKVVLCGIPIDDSLYMNGRPAKTFEDHNVLKAYRSAIAEDTEYHSKIISMSGWTKELLGGSG